MKVKRTTAKTLSYLGAALSEGQLVKGVQKGPDIIRKSGIFNLLKNNYGIKVQDYGNIITLDQDHKIQPINDYPVRNLHILGSVLGRLHHKAYEVINQKDNQFMLTVGGDHSIGSATISAVKRKYQELKVVWVDAHPDCTNANIRSKGRNLSQNYHGMPLSHLTGIAYMPSLQGFKWISQLPKLNPKNVVLIAIRDIDDDEYESLSKYGIKCFTMDHIDKYGIGEVMTQTVNYLDPNGSCPFHLSFDVDGIDPEVVGQTGTRFRYGLSARQSVHIVRRLAHETNLVSMDLVELNEHFSPTEEIRKNQRGQSDLYRVSKSVGMCADLISSVFTRYLTL